MNLNTNGTLGNHDSLSTATFKLTPDVTSNSGIETYNDILEQDLKKPKNSELFKPTKEFLHDSSKKLREETNIGVVLQTLRTEGLVNPEKFTNKENLIVTSVVSCMQDKIIDIYKSEVERLHIHIEEQRRFFISLSHGIGSVASSFKQLYTTPFITLNKEKENGGGEPPKIISETVNKYLNWGNFLALVTIICAGIACYMTNMTADFERQYLRADAETKELTAELKELKAMKLTQDSLLRSLNAEKENLIARNADLKDELGDKEKEIKTATSKLNFEEGNKGKLDAKITVLKSSIIAKDIEIQGLKSQVNMYKNAAESYSQIVADLRKGNREGKVNREDRKQESNELVEPKNNKDKH